MDEYPGNLLEEFTGDEEYQKRKVAEGMKLLEEIRLADELQRLNIQKRNEAELNEITDGEKRILRKYFTEDVSESSKFFRRHLPPSVDAVIAQTVNNVDSPVFNMDAEKVAPLLDALTKISPATIHEQYLQLHNNEYKMRLGTLIEPVSIDKKNKIGKAKIVICIAARNETNLSQTIAALEKSYGPGFAQDVAITIYHNYNGNFVDLPADVLADLNKVATYPNVAVIHEQLETGITTPEVKKVASDLLVNLIPREANPHILFADADIVEISPEAIQKSQALLDATKIPFGAITASELPDPELNAIFPLLYEYEIINNYVHDYQIINGHKKPVTLGGFTLTDKVSFAASGGWMPEELHEDMRFTQQLSLATCGFAQARHPVKDAHLDANVQVMFNPSRQVEAQLQRINGSSFSESNYKNRSGKKRIDWKKLKPEDVSLSPLLARETTIKGRTVMLHKFLTDNYPPDIQNWSIDKYTTSRVPTIQQGFLKYLTSLSDAKNYTFKVYDFGDGYEKIINTTTDKLNDIDLTKQVIVEVFETN